MKIGLLGLGRVGTYHLERISLRSDLEVVAACPVAADLREGAPAHGGHPYLRVDDVLARNDLDYVLVAVPQQLQAELATEALEAGQNVAVEPPMGASYDEARKMLATARRCGRNLCVISCRRNGLNFRIAQQVVQSARLGALVSARLISWAKAVPDDFCDPADAPQLLSADQSEGAFGFFAFQYVDQLLQLFQRPPQSVFANIRGVPASDSTAAAFLLSIVFPDGGDALIDVNLHSGAEMQTGWMLAGSHGAFCGQRIYLADPSGEICDAPMTDADLAEADPYAELLQPARPEGPRFGSARDAMIVMRVLDAARESSRTAKAVRLDERHWLEES